MGLPEAVVRSELKLVAELDSMSCLFLVIECSFWSCMVLRVSKMIWVVSTIGYFASLSSKIINFYNHSQLNKVFILLN